MKSKPNKIATAVQRCRANPADHRRWKKLLRICAESMRAVKQGAAVELTTCADKSARRAVKKYLR